jgi:hypothetical protein
MKKLNKKMKILKKKHINKKFIKNLNKKVLIKSKKIKHKMVTNETKKNKKIISIKKEKVLQKTTPKIVIEESYKEPEIKKKKSSDKMYFTKDTEMYIIKYNKEEDQNQRNHIYETYIKNAFEKLVENVFNTFKFTYFDNSPIEIQKETVAHLVSNMNKFEEGKGKAFSYFSIVAKNYLIFHNNGNYRKYNQHVNIADTPSESSVCLQTIDPHYKEVETNEFLKLMVNYWERNIGRIFSKQRDLNIANAVIELFRNCDRIDAFNKKALYLYIREISSCKTQQITKVINKMKSYQKVIAQSYLDKGKLNS